MYRCQSAVVRDVLLSNRDREIWVVWAPPAAKRRAADWFFSCDTPTPSCLTWSSSSLTSVIFTPPPPSLTSGSEAVRSRASVCGCCRKASTGICLDSAVAGWSLHSFADVQKQNYRQCDQTLTDVKYMFFIMKNWLSIRHATHFVISHRTQPTLLVSYFPTAPKRLRASCFPLYSDVKYLAELFLHAINTFWVRDPQTAQSGTF